MSSISTTYITTLLIGSIVAFVATFAGTKIYPIQEGGSVTEIVETVKETVAPTPTPEPTPEPQPVPQPEPKPTVNLDELKSKITAGFEGNAEASENIVQFLKTPVRQWQTIAPTFQELTRKFRISLTHPNLNKCPASLLQVCQMVSQKYSNMKDLAQGKEDITELGDQTQQAYNLIKDLPEASTPESTAQTSEATSLAIQ